MKKVDLCEFHSIVLFVFVLIVRVNCASASLSFGLFLICERFHTCISGTEHGLSECTH